MTRLGSSIRGLPGRLSGASAPVRGVLWMVLAAGLLTCMAAVVRHLSETGMHTFEIVFFRTVLGVPFMAPWLLRNRMAGLRTRKLHVFALRGIVTLIASSCFFGALALAPLADATAIMFSRPLFATVFALLFLNEAVSGRRWTAMAFGFVGVLIIVRPGFAEVNVGLLLAMAGALFGAGVASIVRYLARTESPDTITFYYSVFMPLFAIGPALFYWQNPTWEQWLWILFMGFVGTLGQRAMTRAIASADVAIVLPVDFSRLVFAAILGWVLFAEFPAVWTWLGGALIFGSSIYTARHEAMQRKQGGNA